MDDPYAPPVRTLEEPEEGCPDGRGEGIAPPRVSEKLAEERVSGAHEGRLCHCDGPIRQGPHGQGAVLRVYSEGNWYGTGLGVYGTHGRHLVVLFLEVALVDADGVGPERRAVLVVV